MTKTKLLLLVLVFVLGVYLFSCAKRLASCVKQIEYIDDGATVQLKGELE